jgi:hypothetical protein
MQYKTFLAKGFLIGSWAMEAAHKDVLQQSLKLSGQRWTREGLQQLTQLRVVYKRTTGTEYSPLQLKMQPKRKFVVHLLNADESIVLDVVPNIANPIIGYILKG